MTFMDKSSWLWYGHHELGVLLPPGRPCGCASSTSDSDNHQLDGIMHRHQCITFRRESFA